MGSPLPRRTQRLRRVRSKPFAVDSTDLMMLWPAAPQYRDAATQTEVSPARSAMPHMLDVQEAESTAPWQETRRPVDQLEATLSGMTPSCTRLRCRDVPEQVEVHTPRRATHLAITPLAGCAPAPAGLPSSGFSVPSTPSEAREHLQVNVVTPCGQPWQGVRQRMDAVDPVLGETSPTLLPTLPRQPDFAVSMATVTHEGSAASMSCAGVSQQAPGMCDTGDPAADVVTPSVVRPPQEVHDRAVARGCLVRIRNLLRRPALNEAAALVVGDMLPSGRWPVRVAGVDAAVSIKAANFCVVRWPTNLHLHDNGPAPVQTGPLPQSLFATTASPPAAQSESTGTDHPPGPITTAFCGICEAPLGTRRQQLCPDCIADLACDMDCGEMIHQDSLDTDAADA